jgi:hypothetical protein
MNRLINNIINLLMLIQLMLIPALPVHAQQLTQVKGYVIDASTKEPLPFVNIVFEGKNIGATTDYNGQYSIATQWASNRITASFLGYRKQTKLVETGKRQVINFELTPDSLNLEEVEIVSKRKRYRNKNNPAVELIKRVVKNKDNNRLEKLNYYTYDKYEKVEFDINNITEKFRKKKIFKKIQFIFSYVDTSELNGKPYLPFFLKETLSEVYYRKTPKDKKEYIKASKMIGFHDYLDNQGIGHVIDNMYQNVNIYDNNINLLTNQFTSPISPLAPTIYKFHIIDTLNINGYRCINIAFMPRNKFDFAFVGNLYVTDDEELAVVKVDMRVTKYINLNFVKDLQIVQEFTKVNQDVWLLNKDKLVVDYNIANKSTGLFGRRTNYYDNYILNKPFPDTVFKGAEKSVRLPGSLSRTDEYWKQNRISELSEKEENIYSMVDSVQHDPAFKRTIDVIMLFVAGYWNFNKIDIGPVNTFYSFNDVEGFRLRLGGRTSDKLSKTFRMEGFVVYGFKDERFKYSAKATLSLNKQPLREIPKHSIMAMYQRETNFPGMEMQFINEDNFLLSFKRGVADKILYYDMFKLEYYRDWKNDISTTLNFKYMEEKPGGTLKFNYADYTKESIISSEIITTIRYAPNETFYQGLDYRTPIITKYPIFQFTYTQGFQGLFNADYQYSKFKFNFFKRFYLSPIGFTNFEIEAGKLFGSEIPFPNMFIHRANQTYSYQIRSYNLMNFLEFVSDQYASLFVEHHFNGFIMNKIPLMRRLKWRSIITFKGIYGGVSDKNNPNVTDGLMLFPVDMYGNPTTFTLKDKPYIEISAGIGNILKFFRVDVVKRVTYLDNPNVQEYGIRARFKFDF